MFAGVIKTQELLGPGPTISRYIPNPRPPIPEHQNPQRPPQPPPQRLPMQPPSQFDSLPLPTDHHFLAQHASVSFPSRLLLQIKHPRLDFVPFHPLFLGLFPAPARPTIPCL